MTGKLLAQKKDAAGCTGASGCAVHCTTASEVAGSRHNTLLQQRCIQPGAVATARRLYDALNKRDVAALAACFAADVQYNNLAFMEGFTGATVRPLAEQPAIWLGCRDMAGALAPHCRAGPGATHFQPAG